MKVTFVDKFGGIMERHLNSTVVIARLLDSEGFTPHVANGVARFALKQATVGQRRRYKRTKRIFSELAKTKLTDTDKMVLGKFMSAKLEMSFNTGLRIGLTAFAEMSQEEKNAFVIAAKNQIEESDN